MDPLSIAAVGWSITAVGWLMSALVSKAVTTLLEAWAKCNRLENEFKTLKRQLLQLGALLTSARRCPTDNTFLDEMVQDLQQLAYQAENLLDELDYYRLEDEILQRGTEENVNCSNQPSAASSSSGSRFARCSLLSTWKGMSCCSAPDVLEPLPKTSRNNMSQRMNELAKQLQKSEEEVRKAVETELLVIHTQNTEISETEATNLPQTSPFHTEHREVVGRDQERDQLLNLLTNEDTTTVGKVHVLAIVGCGGVGKTTLAGLVFNNANIESCFDVKSWICVSTRFDILRLTREMLESTCGNRYDGLSNLEALQKILKDKLKLKRFLLVLDDMWEDKNQSQWDKMIALLNNCMVKWGIILVTTRNQSVAEMVHARDNIYLRGLDYNAFLSFFSTCIFNDPNYGGNWRLKKVGQEIAKKLKGNPLAAKTVSAMLKKNLDERYWMKIRDSEEWKSQRGPNDIMPALRLSYEHMPFHLQRCFSYCAIFPQDHPFTCNELVYLWMAQGFLDIRSEGKRMEDIGSDYLNDLVNRGFFQTTKSADGVIVFCTFHDLIHDLARMVAFKECLTEGLEPTQIPPTIRHLSISYSTKKAEPEETIVRALACLEGENLSTIINWDELPSRTFQSISELLKKTKFLRAVTLSSGICGLIKFQNFVSLRYLKLIISYNNTCTTLPREICRLYHLEVFQIERGWFLEELPINVIDLVSLRHLIARGSKLHSMIWGVGKLTSLQELNYFDVQQKKGFEIEQLGSLKEIGGFLHISNLENVKSMNEASKARLAEKKKLDALYLQWDYGEQENRSVLEGLKPNTNLKSLQILGYGGVVSPTWLDPSMIFLESLTLKGCKALDLLPPIGDLEFLKHLKLYGLAVREIGPQCYGTSKSMKFPSLEVLEIHELPDLEKWVWTDQLELFHCFKKLKKLAILDCTKLVDIPLSGCATSEALKRFPSLERLIIKDCPLISQLSPLPYSSILSSISIENTGFIRYMNYVKKQQKLSFILDRSSSLKVVEVLAIHELSSLHYLELSYISSLESLDLHFFVALEDLNIRGCQSLTSLKFGEHLVCLKSLRIIDCKTLCSMKGLKSWVNLRSLFFYGCPSFIAAWDTALEEIERTEPNFTLSLIKIDCDSLSLLTIPICKQLTSLISFELEFYAFTEEQEVSLQLLTCIDLVDIRGCNNLQSFPFDLFPSLKKLTIRFPWIRSLPTSRHIEIIEGCKKLRNIKEVDITKVPLEIHFEPRREEMICQQMDADN